MIEFLTTCLNIFIKYWPSILLGIRTTLLIALLGTFLGLGLGLVVGGLKAIQLDKNASKALKITKKIYDAISTIYIEVFRGTPMMVQAVFLYYLLRPVFNWSPTVAAVFVISVNTGAYMSEIIRSGIQAVDKGQTEAARSLGMSSMQTMMLVVLPQAIRNAFPAIGNEFIVNIKDSSVLMVLSVTELMFQMKSIAGSNFKFVETYFVTACIYLSLTLITSYLLRLVEKKLNNTTHSYPASVTVPGSVNKAQMKEEENNGRY
ncbi:MAG: amino acid ABC transporter permease [Erysipelotrichaceae bacterium]|nr:amino acid ABC transporter permease [Erysipelotrichaceae bacterium]